MDKRIKIHNRYLKIYEFIIKHLALRLLKKSKYTKNNKSKDNLIIVHSVTKEYDLVPSCNSPLKEFCRSHNRTIKAYFGPFVVYGDSMIEIYFEIIEVLLLNTEDIPFCK